MLGLLSEGLDLLAKLNQCLTLEFRLLCLFRGLCEGVFWGFSEVLISHLFGGFDCESVGYQRWLQVPYDWVLNRVVSGYRWLLPSKYGLVVLPLDLVELVWEAIFLEDHPADIALEVAIDHVAVQSAHRLELPALSTVKMSFSEGPVHELALVVVPFFSVSEPFI
jgi:hypothetical protein